MKACHPLLSFVLIYPFPGTIINKNIWIWILNLNLDLTEDVGGDVGARLEDALHEVEDEEEIERWWETHGQTYSSQRHQREEKHGPTACSVDG